MVVKLLVEGVYVLIQANCFDKISEKMWKKEITIIKNLKWISSVLEKHFPKNPFYFRIYADSEAANENGNSSMGKNN